MKFRNLHLVLPLLPGFAACSLTTSLDGLQGGAGGAIIVGRDSGVTDTSEPDSAPELVDKSEVIVSKQEGLRGITYNKALYWVDAATPAIWTADKGGLGAKTLLTSTHKVDAPFDVEVSDRYLYWTEIYTGLLWRALGTNTSLVGPKMPRAGFVTAIDDFNVLVSDLEGDANGKTIWKQGTRLYSRMNAVRGLARLGDFIYWAEPMAIYRGAKDGSQPVKEADANKATGVATNGLQIFWIEDDNVLIQQKLGDPTSKKTVFRAVPPQTLFDVAASSTHVYWTDPGTKTIRRLEI